MSLISQIGVNLAKYRRVLYLAKKPNREEFMVIAKITGIGMVLIGFLGFVVFLAFNIFKQGGVL